MPPSAPDVPVRDAATIVLHRAGPDGQQVLMGQRGARAVFMPDKFVFPGGALDPGDLALATAHAPDTETARRLAIDATPEVARALPLAGVRELWEETGLRLGAPDPGAAASHVPEAWRGFFAAGLRPRCEVLRLIFRAVTPPGRPRRFDARFFLADAADLAVDPEGGGEDFVATDAELRHLQWLDIAAARALPVPFITDIVLSEIAAHFGDPGAARPVPYFRHEADGSHFRML